MSSRTSLDELNELDPAYAGERVPLTKHMVSSWHRHWRDDYHLNSDQSRLALIARYVAEYLPGRQFALSLTNPRLVSALGEPLYAHDRMTVLAHEIWKLRFRADPRFNIYTPEGFAAFAGWMVAEIVSPVPSIRTFVTAEMVAAVNLPAWTDGRHFTSVGVDTLWRNSPLYQARYPAIERWQDREAFNFDLICHALVRDGNADMIAPEVLRYWSDSPSHVEPRLSRFVIAAAMLSERFGHRLQNAAAAFASADEIDGWFGGEVLPAFPAMAQLAPRIQAPAAVADAQPGRQTATMRRADFTARYGIGAFPGESDREIDVLVLGPFAAASGLGTGTRRSINALEAAGADFRLVNFAYDNPSAPIEPIPEALAYKGERPKVTLWHYNGEYLPEAMQAAPDFINPNRNIGFFFWETEVMPQAHQLGCDMLDEIWSPSAFVQHCYEGHGTLVTNVGTYAELPRIDHWLPRSHFGLDDDEFVYMFSFDAHSVIQRKNPAAIARAFRRAFPLGSERARLVIKTQNLFDARWGRVNGRNEELLELASSDRRIQIVNRTMSLAELYSLKKASDCYISLHRSEGFGYGPAEAMALGKPTIMTGYSANVEFATPDNCLLVRNHLVHIPHGEYLYWVPEMVWAEADIGHAAECMRRLFDDPELAARLGAEAAITMARDFGRQAVGARYRARLEALGAM